MLFIILYLLHHDVNKLKVRNLGFKSFLKTVQALKLAFHLIKTFQHDLNLS